MTYHLRRQDRESADPTRLEQIIREQRYAVIALCRDNEPYVVTLDYGYDAENGALYFHCAKEGKKIDFIKANPAACATIIAEDDAGRAVCDHSYRSVAINGILELVDSREEIDRAIHLMIEQLETAEPVKERAKLNEKNPFYVNLQILKLRIGTITGKKRIKK